MSTSVISLAASSSRYHSQRFRFETRRTNALVVERNSTGLSTGPGNVFAFTSVAMVRPMAFPRSDCGARSRRLHARRNSTVRRTTRFTSSRRRNTAARTQRTFPQRARPHHAPPLRTRCECAQRRRGAARIRRVSLVGVGSLREPSYSEPTSYTHPQPVKGGHSTDSERDTGFEPATSSLGSWHSTN